ncbi:papain fold toxin domain-containing protein [Argonema galeatum]|uniref:papain fold toxin domain-containing protein n=1 Tax=Argonema galeatum TaxID=2942762 RepID=UPI0020138209|nr:papain fold toxin domain-containing protein [Argonema galeatum]MCL1462873.1 hypothetical protein [Argonema galeatum A003/A1]
MSAIASNYENLKCVECALALKDYLLSQGIHGKHIKLYTGTAIGRSSYIYDDSIPGEPISLNGCHQGIIILIDAVEIVFDNHHPNGVPRDEWMNNLLFYGKLHYGQQFKVTEKEF